MRSFCKRSSRFWKHRSKLTISPCCSLSLNSGVLRHPPDFAALALSCRRLKDVAEEALYTHDLDYGSSLAVHWAAEQGSIATLDKALRYGLDIHQNSPALDSSPLYTAVVHGKDLAVAWFLDHGADVTLTGRSDCACPVSKSGFLHTALCYRHISTAQLLISREAPLYYPSDEHSRANALLEASFYGLDTIVESLVKDYGMSLQTRYSPSYHDALACAAMSEHNVSTIRTLVGLGADVNGSHNEWEASPLYVAIDEGNFGVANALLDLGADIRPYERDVHIDPVIDGDDDEIIQSETVQVHVAPLHAILQSPIDGRAPRQWFHAPNPFTRDSSEHWQAERTSFMKRLIQLGVDINMKALGSSWTGDGFEHWLSPLDLAVDIGTAQDVKILIASGAEVSHRMLHTNWMNFDTGQDEKVQKKARLLLKHGARLDEPIRNLNDMTLLRSIAHDSDRIQQSSGLHELLLLSSPRSLSSGHLNEVLEECLADLDSYPSTILIRHGARVSCKDKLFSIASVITQELRIDRHSDDLQDLEQDSLVYDDQPTSRMGLVIEMGLSNEDQCLIFRDVLHKRALTLAHLFLDRGVATTPEASTYLPAYLMLAASWGNICVIKRLWQQLEKDLELTILLSIVQDSIFPGNREAVSFFMGHGATPFQYLKPAQAQEQLRSARDALFAEDAALHRRGDAIGSFPDNVCERREHKRAQLLTEGFGSSHHYPNKVWRCFSPLDLAVQCGHLEIISDLLEQTTDLSKTGSTNTCRKIYIPCVLRKANEIQEMIEGAGLKCE